MLSVLRCCLLGASSSAMNAQWFGNAILAPPAQHSTTAGATFNITTTRANVNLDLFSARFDAVITAPVAGAWQFAVATNGAVRMWIDDHILVDSSCDVAIDLGLGSAYRGVCDAWDVPHQHKSVIFHGRDNITHNIEQGLHLRMEWMHYGGGDAELSLLWRPGTPSSSLHSAPFVAVPSSALSTTIPVAEVWRQELQQNLTKGWNTWMRDSANRYSRDTSSLSQCS